MGILMVKDADILVADATKRQPSLHLKGVGISYSLISRYLLVVCPHLQHPNNLLLFQHLINQTMLNVNSA